MRKSALWPAARAARARRERQKVLQDPAGACPPRSPGVRPSAIANRRGDRTNSKGKGMETLPPNESRLSCGALVKDQISDVRCQLQALLGITAQEPQDPDKSCARARR